MAIATINLIRTSGLSSRLAILLAVLGTVCLGMPVSGSHEVADSDRNWNVILISIDTLRADHVGVYGYRKSITPNLDRLAKEGIHFDEVYTPVPLTLPAHASLLTGQYPFQHGVRDNGEALPDSVPTLAQYLHEQGLRTAAFVGAFVLDRRFGLARGFDEYWGQFQLYRYAGKDPGTIQIRGDNVEAAAEQWFAAHRKDRFFAFVHFYDLHGPYLLPDDWRHRFGEQLYDGELAFTDNLVGKLWAALQRFGLSDHTALLITADHGEGLGDHGELHHGFFLYNSTIHVPLIIRLPKERFSGLEVHSVAHLIDIAPTVCTLLGLRPVSSFQGRDLMSEVGGKPSSTLAAYSETLYPYRHFHTAPLYALQTSRYTFISAPRRELYDRLRDPKQAHNLAIQSSGVTKQLAEDLTRITGTPPQAGTVRIDPGAMKALNALGYVGTISGPSSEVRELNSLPDPKDRISLYNKYLEALALGYQGQLAKSATALDKIAFYDPALLNVQIDAGLAYRALDQEGTALRRFKAAVRADPKNALAHFHLGASLSNLHRDKEAAEEFVTAAKLEPWFSQAYTAEGLVKARMGDLASAKVSFDRALDLDPEDYDAWLNRGKLFTISNRWDDAKRDLQYALSLEPSSPAVYQALGTLAFYCGNLGEALGEYERAAELDASNASIHADMGLLYGRLRRTEDARAEFRKALELDPTNKEAKEALQGTR